MAMSVRILSTSHDRCWSVPVASGVSESPILGLPSGNLHICEHLPVPVAGPLLLVFSNFNMDTDTRPAGARSIRRRRRRRRRPPLSERRRRFRRGRRRQPQAASGLRTAWPPRWPRAGPGGPGAECQWQARRPRRAPCGPRAWQELGPRKHLHRYSPPAHVRRAVPGCLC
jgi:hypothetical protein